MSNITVSDVKRLAEMSALAVTDEQAAVLRGQLEEILGYVAQLDDVDVTGVAPTYQVTELENVTRPDEIEQTGVSRDDLLQNAPATLHGHIKVKKVL